MINSFERLAGNIKDINIVGKFDDPSLALNFVKNNNVDLAFLDIKMPIVNGIELARNLRAINKNILIVFVSAYEDYIKEFNEVGGDYYIIKPYDEEILSLAMERIRLISKRQQKNIYLQMFGRFVVFMNGKPLRIQGKAKEILALIASKRGKEISNEEIFYTIWENRPYSNENMGVYYNAIRRLKEMLKDYEIENLVISTVHGQMINVDMVDCDYYMWLDGKNDSRNKKIKKQQTKKERASLPGGESAEENLTPLSFFFLKIHLMSHTTHHFSSG